MSVGAMNELFVSGTLIQPDAVAELPEVLWENGDLFLHLTQQSELTGSRVLAMFQSCERVNLSEAIRLWPSLITEERVRTIASR